MKHIRLFEQHSYIDEIHEICRQYNITNYTINDDMSIDVDGIVNLYRKGLTELPLQFNRVSESFECPENRLTTLKGCPKYVGGSFYCNENKLTSLQYAPKEVAGGIFISNNELPIELFNFSNRKILKYQDEYGIWNEDGSFNMGRWNIFAKDYDADIL